jgi:hypothetical protein
MNEQMLLSSSLAYISANGLLPGPQVDINPLPSNMNSVYKLQPPTHMLIYSEQHAKP